MLSPLFVVALALCCATVARAQISPGPLSRAHQQLEGLTKCGSCHEFGTTTRGFKCLGCHAEIRRRVETKAGFHARAYKSSAGETDCRRCHQEHKGQTTALIRLDRQKFDHFAQTGFALAGKHQQQKCGSCHVATKISADARTEIKLKDLNRSFLGLRRECTACHKDQHQGQLGADCLRCHTMDGFKPATGFNHAATHFPLTGLHQTEACQKCHGPRPGQENPQYKGLTYSGCQSCHTDPHRGAFQDVKFRGSCDNCHNTNGWKNNRPGAEFNHATTKFPLLEKHAAVVCSACHKGTDFRRPIAHERCQQCHEDPHNRQFATRAAGSDCSSCHNLTGFKPAKFDRETHRQTAFPIEGKHAALRCAECHQPEGRGAVYISRKLVCSACHADRHGGEFAAAPHANQCDQCHTSAGFQATTFTVARHAETQFALTGKHATVTCDKCHKPLPAGGTALPLAPVKAGTPVTVPRQYHFASRTCNTCHTDPHQTKLACEGCHTSEQWKEVSTFDHSKTKFKIDGAHLNVKCIQCHKPSEPVGGGPAKVAPEFSKTPTQCLDCHNAKDAHAGQFKSGPAEDCGQCHVTARWNGEAFNHDKTPFVLNRDHRDVACAKCHKDQRESAGKMIRIYRGTTTECVKCH
ncbi:MAG TPA: hypothetical protein VNY05_05165 [Candidatus Acidoferrales bacterium]|nr:hypothetical protein [Candidatus Acidoferrales bacterium]